MPQYEPPTPPNMLHRVSLLAAAVCAVAAGAAHAQARTVNVVASEYRFEAPDSIPAGLTTFRLVAHGREIHHMQLVRFAAGKSLADFAEAMKQPGPPPAWVTFLGGPNAGIPDGQHATMVTENVAPGNYAIFCVIPSADGQMHLMKGMIKPLTVTGAVAATQEGLPRADVVLTLYDYNFDTDKPLTAGHHTILVRNTAQQVHEAFIAKLPPGASAQSFLDWVGGGMKGPPPVMPAGGIVGISPGQENLLTLDLEPGNYALYCFVPDAKDGKEHVKHGMFKQFTVAAK